MPSHFPAVLVLFAAVAAAEGDAGVGVGVGVGAVLTVKVTAIHSTKGKIACTLYRGEAGFPTDPKRSIQQRVCEIEGTVSTCRFDPIPADTYAVACFHDEDSNGKLNSNFIGIPKEGVGVSRDAKGSFGPPKYEDAKFLFSGAPTEITFGLRY